jgi:hypothetical protein
MQNFSSPAYTLTDLDNFPAFLLAKYEIRGMFWLMHEKREKKNIADFHVLVLFMAKTRFER